MIVTFGVWVSEDLHPQQFNRNQPTLINQLRR